jgi:hypothetical protein
MVMSRTPSGARASSMALITTAKAGVQPPSPPALMPNGLVGGKRDAAVEVRRQGHCANSLLLSRTGSPLA